MLAGKVTQLIPSYFKRHLPNKRCTFTNYPSLPFYNVFSSRLSSSRMGRIVLSLIFFFSEQWNQGYQVSSVVCKSLPKRRETLWQADCLITLSSSDITTKHITLTRNHIYWPDTIYNHLVIIFTLSLLLELPVALNHPQPIFYEEKALLPNHVVICSQTAVHSPRYDKVCH